MFRSVYANGEIPIKEAKVPGNENSTERKFHRTFVPGSEKAWERKGQGAKGPRSESSRERIGHPYWPIRSREQIGPGAKRLGTALEIHSVLSCRIDGYRSITSVDFNVTFAFSSFAFYTCSLSRFRTFAFYNLIHIYQKS